MLRFYLRFLWTARKIVGESTSRARSLVALGTTAIATASPLIAPRIAPWLAKQGVGDLAAWFAWVPWWWSAIPVGLFVLYGLLRANYELHLKTEAERDARTQEQSYV